MSDRESFTKAILAAPADDLPRLVFADWLDEQGEPERAEFIRVQCELAKRLKPGDLTPGCSCNRSGCRVCETINPLRRREMELLYSRGDEWFAPDRQWGVALSDTPDLSIPHVVVRRGFVAEVHAPLAVLIGGECGRCGGLGEVGYIPGADCLICEGTGRTPGALAAIVRRQPVGRMTVTDREPWEDEEGGPGEYGWCWWRESAWGDRAEGRNRIGNLPDAVFDLIAELYPESRLTWGGPPSNQHLGFPARNAALSALSAALLAWAKSIG